MAVETGHLAAGKGEIYSWVWAAAHGRFASDSGPMPRRAGIIETGDLNGLRVLDEGEGKLRAASFVREPGDASCRSPGPAHIRGG